MPIESLTGFVKMVADKFQATRCLVPASQVAPSGSGAIELLMLLAPCPASERRANAKGVGVCLRLGILP